MSNKNNKWLRVLLQGTKKYGYVLVDNKDKPVLFNSDSGYFKVYDSPNTLSHYYNTYLTPKNKSSNNTVNDNNPVQLKEVQITAKKPTEFVGILRTPDDHLAALARDRAVDAKVNPLNDLLQNFFANLMTGGMYSAVDLGTKNLAKGNYLEGAMQTATPIMFGPAESTVANLTRLGVGAYDLLSKNGVLKTYNLAKLGNWFGAARSAAGDALNLGMTLGGGYNLGKYNIPSFVLWAAKNGNNTARSYLISKELNLNIKNFDGTVGEEYFLNPVPYRWVRVSETPEVHGLLEMGKNVTTTDAYNIHVPSNDWRVSHIKDFTFKDGQWYKKPKKKFSLTKFGLAHGDTSLAAYGKVWDGTFAYSGQFPRVRLEGEAYNKVYRGFDPATGSDSRTNFVLLNVDDIPMGSRVGFHTGEMPMENLLYFLLLPNGRWAIKGLILPNKNLYVDTPKATRYLFDSPTYLMYTGPQHDISEVINENGSINLKNLLNILNEALKNIPGGTIARHRLENKQWHPTDWNTFLHTRDVYKRALLYNYPKEALFPTLMHDAGKLWAGDGHGPYGASIIQLIFPKASKEQILAIYGHMDANPSAQLTRYVKGVDIKEPNQFRYFTPKTTEPTDDAFTFKMPNLAYSTSLNTSTNRPYYLLFGNNSGNMMIQDIKKGRNEFVNWMNNPKYREAAELNKLEATSMGLSYTPTYEKPQYSWMLKYGIKPEFKSKMEGEGATSWMGALEGTPTSVEYNLSSKIPYDKVTRHEVGHVSLHGNGKNAEELKYLRYKTHLAFKDDANVGPYDFHQLTGEAAMNGRDLGADLGISVGLEYPGYLKALDIINSNYKNSNKAGMVNVLKLDKESMPYVWKLLNGTLLGGTAFTTYNLNNNGLNK